MYSWEKQQRDDRFLKERRNPSFSSTLLDEIFRSIDDGGAGRNGGGKATARASEIERCWMDKKIDDEVSHRRRGLSPPGPQRESADRDYDSPFFSSSSGSSDSSSGGFSSSEAESVPRFDAQKLKPIRTTVSAQSASRGRAIKTERAEKKKPLNQKQRGSLKTTVYDDDDRIQNSVRRSLESETEGRFIEPKSRASRIPYGDLKKTKQPVSPGARLAAFLNSLFTARNSKKQKKTMQTKTTSPSLTEVSGDAISDGWFLTAQSQESNPNCSSASSFSRSCLSSKTSPRAKSRDGVKRSVRFGPVSVIIVEDCRPSGHKCLLEENPIAIRRTGAANRRRSDLEGFKSRFSEKSPPRARDVFKNIHEIQKKKKKKRNELMKNNVGEDEVNENDDDDAASCSSSDLFELDDLALIGNGRFREELPVYETTHLHANPWMRS